MSTPYHGKQWHLQRLAGYRAAIRGIPRERNWFTPVRPNSPDEAAWFSGWDLAGKDQEARLPASPAGGGSGKFRCEDCGWVGEESEALIARHPFLDGLVYGCPKCLEVQTLRPACDEPGCNEFVTCGTPTPTGYRCTCGQHRPIE